MGPQTFKLVCLPLRVITITANYGLGESVVGALVDPDVFVVGRATSGHLTILSRTTGGKKIRIDEDVNGGTVQKYIGEEGALNVSVLECSLCHAICRGICFIPCRRTRYSPL